MLITQFLGKLKSKFPVNDIELLYYFFGTKYNTHLLETLSANTNIFWICYLKLDYMKHKDVSLPWQQSRLWQRTVVNPFEILIFITTLLGHFNMLYSQDKILLLLSTNCVNICTNQQMHIGQQLNTSYIIWRKLPPINYSSLLRQYLTPMFFQ